MGNEISFATIILPGPSNPDCRNVESFFQRRQVVKLYLPVGLGSPFSSHCGHFSKVPFSVRSLSSGSCSSPIIRFTQRLTTLISNLFLPDFAAPEMSN